MSRAARVIASLVEYAEHLAPAYRDMLRRYVVADVAHRVVGVGSVGTRAYLVLCFGNGDSDPLFLQVKEAIVPVHGAYLPPAPLRKEQHDGQRIVLSPAPASGARRPATGLHHDRRARLLRAANEEHEGLDARVVDDGRTVRLLGIHMWGLAGALPCACRRSVRIASYCGEEDTLDRALADFAETYGDQTERDHAELVKAIKAGRVTATAAEEGE